MDINLIAPICDTGYGTVGLNLLLALERSGHEVCLLPRGQIEVAQEHGEVIQKALGRRDRPNPDAPAITLAQHASPDLLLTTGRGLHCAFIIFELDTFRPDEIHRLRGLDRVLTCSEWGKRVLVENGLNEEQVRVVPLGVDGSLFANPPEPPARENGDTIFFSTGKFEFRKGYDFLSVAFSQAFAPDDPVRLVLHAWNPFLGDEYNQTWVDLFQQTPMAARVEILRDRFETQAPLAGLMAQADCGVFLSRAEGWNLGLLEMMALSKPVIATDYSGHTEFLNADNCRLVDVPETEPANDGLAFQGQGNWAKLDLPQAQQAIAHLRTIHEQKQSGQLPPNTAGIETARKFSWDHAAARLVEAVQ